MATGYFSTKRPSGLICIECDVATTPGDRSICHRLFCALRPVVRVKIDMPQNTASQSLCDGWAEYRQNAYIS